MQSTAERARFNMIEQQVRPWGVLDEKVLSVMGALPREAFVPDGYRGLAYADIEVPLSGGTTMLAPKLVGRLLQALDLAEGDEILEIGTGTGYLTACLARLGKRVVSIEIDPELAEGARERLSALGLNQVEIRAGDGLASAVDGGPFDAIAVTGSVPTSEPLAALQQQLRDRGRLFAVVGEAPVMEAQLITRIGNDFRRQSLLETAIPALQNAPQPERFAF